MNPPPKRPTNKADQKIEKELDNLLFRLAKIQDGVGMGAEEEKKENGGKKTRTQDRFHEVRQQVLERLEQARKLIEESADGKLIDNPDLLIRNQQAIRDNLKQADDELANLQNIYRKEASKRISKIPKEELEERRQLVQVLRNEHKKLQDAHQSQYAPAPLEDRFGGGVSLQDSELFRGGGGDLESGSSWATPYEPGGGGPRHQEEGISHAQQQRLDQLLQRDRDQDAEHLTRIEQGVEDALDLAMAAHEEERRQVLMIDNLETNLDRVNLHAENTNKKLKETLKKVRGADKFCVDIMCIVLMLGMLGILYSLAKDQGVF